MVIFFTSSRVFCFCGILLFFLESTFAAKIRVGHFPNITHAQALIGHHSSRTNKGWFQERIGKPVEIEWHVFNAGSSAMEAIFTGGIDLAYVGPAPTINAHVRSGGDVFRIVSGACSGGSALVLRENSGINKLEDFRNRRIATPQLANTQDVAARHYFRKAGFKVTLTGGDLLIVPTSNPDQLILFQKGSLDGAWTVEPWVTRLLRGGNARIFLEEKDLWPETKGKYITTHLVSSKKFIENNRELLASFISVHVELTDWILMNPGPAKKLIAAEFLLETRQTVSNDILDEAWERLQFLNDPIPRSLIVVAEQSKNLGFLKGKRDFSQIYDLSVLNTVLRQKGFEEIKP